MNKIAVLFGGSGYIGGHLLQQLLKGNYFDKYFVLDIGEPKYCLQSHKNEKVVFHNLDVRKKISFHENEVDLANSWIFNFAAVHREPGHEYQEYFNTNIPGAENVCEFARKSGIKNILFTSSIAPYGKSLQQRTETSALYPETAYGISKALAEKIHGIWLSEDKKRRLIIVRPSVIFGPKDPGNVYRMIKSLKKGTFILPNGGKVIKGYGYIYGLVESMLFTMQKEDRFILYNYAENPLVPLNEMVSITKEQLNFKKPTLMIPVGLLAIIAFFIQLASKLLGKSSDIHPVRVRKAGFPTNIKPEYLIKNNFHFNYSYPEALKHWKNVAPEDFEL
ncbi:N-acetyl-alpha-D-glucosaminyl-diphospho-ditrans, octacis-undecaprenol 4-epimerase [Croceitalea sp. MTPC5]|uniref:NAD-dependent epimerase/dehydratase family protein n=1 Tax=Croceitalea sp. MTPC5 TaxID=3056565 RepID=UPI002B3BA95D|nr:N-acetyl-alpha-D-glucosaminyl-diphospho-ditrans, octacis-undecaprenol 4-epimerase [Croceitalea sp. MTPC5]